MTMNKIPIKRIKPTKIGDSYYFLIPKHYINNMIIEKGVEYNIEIEEVIA